MGEGVGPRDILPQACRELPPSTVSLQTSKVILLSLSSRHGLQHLYPDMNRRSLASVGVKVLFRVNRDDVVDQVDGGCFGMAADLSRTSNVDPHGESNGPFDRCAYGMEDDEGLSVLDEEFLSACELALVAGGCCYVDVCWEGLWSQWRSFPERGIFFRYPCTLGVWFVEGGWLQVVFYLHCCVCLLAYVRNE